MVNLSNYHFLVITLQIYSTRRASLTLRIGSGRAHHILVPYVDENGIPQAPRFGLSSYMRETIRKLASELYLRVVSEKRESIRFSSIADNNIRQPPNKKPISSQDIDDPLKILKIRFAKGEITKEQYEDMRKML
jgi:hypothetical protein